MMNDATVIGFPCRLHLVLAVVALLSLLVTGGTFSHAEEIGLQDHVHAAANAADHSHATECPACEVKDLPIHCGSSILILAGHEEFTVAAGGHQFSNSRFEPLANLPIIPEPPPPRSFPVFDI